MRKSGRRGRHRSEAIPVQKETVSSHEFGTSWSYDVIDSEEKNDALTDLLLIRTCCGEHVVCNLFFQQAVPA